MSAGPLGLAPRVRTMVSPSTIPYISSAFVLFCLLSFYWCQLTISGPRNGWNLSSRGGGGCGGGGGQLAPCCGPYSSCPTLSKACSRTRLRHHSLWRSRWESYVSPLHPFANCSPTTTRITRTQHTHIPLIKLHCLSRQTSRWCRTRTWHCCNLTECHPPCLHCLAEAAVGCTTTQFQLHGAAATAAAVTLDT